MNLQDKIKDLLSAPDLAPETRALLRATLEAQETGKIPTDLGRFMEPTPGEWFIDLDNDISAKNATPGDVVCLAPKEYEESLKRWPANAPILAAAKDMRDALKRLDRPGGVFALIEADYLLSDEHKADIEFARAALAKAAMKGGGQ